MLGESVSSWTRMVPRMSTARLRVRVLGRIAGRAGRALVTRDWPATVSYRNAWWTRMSCRVAAVVSVAGSARASASARGRRLDVAAEEQPAVAGQRVADASGSWPTIPKST